MEFCGCGDLAQKVDRYKKRKQHVDERVIWAYLIQVTAAVGVKRMKRVKEVAKQRVCLDWGNCSGVRTRARIHLHIGLSAAAAAAGIHFAAALCENE